MSTLLKIMLEDLSMMKASHLSSYFSCEFENALFKVSEILIATLVAFGLETVTKDENKPPGSSQAALCVSLNAIFPGLHDPPSGLDVGAQCISLLQLPGEEIMEDGLHCKQISEEDDPADVA